MLKTNKSDRTQYKTPLDTAVRSKNNDITPVLSTNDLVQPYILNVVLRNDSDRKPSFQSLSKSALKSMRSSLGNINSDTKSGSITELKPSI